MRENKVVARKNIEIIKWMLGVIRFNISSLSILIIIGAFISLIGVSIAIISKHVIDAATSGENNLMLQFMFLFAIVIITQTILETLVTTLTNRNFEKLSNNIRSRVFEHVLRSEWVDSSKYHSGDLMTRLTRDIGILTNVIINVIPDIFSLGVGLVAAFVTLFIYSPILAVLAFLIGPFAILFSRLFGRRIKEYHLKIQDAEGFYRSFIQESVGNLQIVKAFSLEKRNLKLLDDFQNESIRLVMKRSKLTAVTNSVLSLGYWIGYFLAFSWGAFSLSKGIATFGTMTAFLQLVGQVHGPIIGLAYTYPKLVSALGSAARLMEIEDMKLEKIGEQSPVWKTAGVLFDGVSFSYETSKPILVKAACEIREGDITALIGPSGEGKTTFIKLILSLIKPTGGSLYFINSEQKKLEVSPVSRSLIAYVPQGNTLFSGTIKDNILVGNSKANDNEVIRAAKAACALEFINKLPEGMDTVIGEMGMGLSEGQAQRIAIARALLKRAPVLILDEATSALDEETERKVLAALKELKPVRTCIVITHRPSAFRICNRILRIQAEGIIEICHGLKKEEVISEMEKCS